MGSSASGKAAGRKRTRRGKAQQAPAPPPASASPAGPPSRTPLLSLGPDALRLVLSRCSPRDVLALGATCKELKESVRDDGLWAALAEGLWGPAVQELGQQAAGEAGGWMRYVVHRLSISQAPLSPLDLVQEHYQGCAFQHIVSCVLCCRTTGGQVVRDAIREFLERYPTPSAVLAGDSKTQLDMLVPLGLQDMRHLAAKGIARDFLAMHWAEPAAFKYCGKFVSDSWRIFCRGLRSAAGVQDSNLLRYLHWRLQGQVAAKPAGKGKSKGKGQRRREAEKQAEAGTLRSGRRREGAEGGRGQVQTSAAGEARQTRAAAQGRTAA